MVTQCFHVATHSDGYHASTVVCQQELLQHRGLVSLGRVTYSNDCCSLVAVWKPRCYRFGLHSQATTTVLCSFKLFSSSDGETFSHAPAPMATAASQAKGHALRNMADRDAGGVCYVVGCKTLLFNVHLDLVSCQCSTLGFSTSLRFSSEKKMDFYSKLLTVVTFQSMP